MSLSVNFQRMDFARLVRLVRLVSGNITMKSVNIHQTVSKSKHVKEDTQNHAKGLPLVIADLLLSVHSLHSMHCIPPSKFAKNQRYM